MNGSVPAFDWDAGSADNKGSAGTGGSSGSFAGTGGTAPMGGSSGGTIVPWGGAAGAGLGGTSGMGGKAGGMGGSATGSGGTGGPPPSLDAGIPTGGSMDGGIPGTGGSTIDAGIGGAGGAGGVDSGAACTARIRALRPTALDRLVAGQHVQIVLRAERDGAGTGTWSWRGLRDRVTSVQAEQGKQDTATAAFIINQAGSYVFTAIDSSGCTATISASATTSDAFPPAINGAMVRASAPLSAQIPVQTGYVVLGREVMLQTGAPVQVGPSAGHTRVDSYVRILCDSETVADGLSSDVVGPFATTLLTSRLTGSTVTPLRYDVLVVPADGLDGGPIDASAPQLFRNLTPAQFGSTSFQLNDGVAVTGSTLLASGDALPDARCVLSNQGPTQKSSSNLLFSSVGRSDSQGRFEFKTQPGSYWVTISPPVGRGLPEAISATPVSVSAGTTLSFTWDNPVTTTVNLRVQDAYGQALPNALVRLSTAEANSVGRLHVHGEFGDVDVQAQGSTRLEATTSSAGLATFSGIPANVTYNVLIVPDVLGPAARTTVVPLRVTTGSINPVVSVQAEAHITGQLVTAPSPPIDLSRVIVVATDKSDEAAEPVQSVRADAQGRFDLAVTPGRVYVLMAIPPGDSAYARTFLDPGPMVATEFPITQRLFSGLLWNESVTTQGRPLPGTALQMFCYADWPNCFDPTIPLAETTAASDGTFSILLPDPTTR